MSARPTPAAMSVRYPLIVVDSSRDPDDYDSGWLRLLGPADVASLHITPTVRVWDSAGRPAAVVGGAVHLTDERADPAAREVLTDWRRRVPVPLMAGAAAGDTAIPFMVNDVLVAQKHLTPEGATRVPSRFRRMLPIVLMLVCAVTLIPLLQFSSWGIGVVVLLYTVTTALMHRWSYPPGWWGNPPKRDEPDLISKLAVATKVVFWSVAAAAVTLTLLDLTGVVETFLPWL